MSTTARGRQLAFLCCGTDWGGHPSTILHVFAHIARDYPVIWVNSIGQRIPHLNIKDAQRALHKVRAMWRRPHASVGMDLPEPRAVVEPRVLPLHHYRWVRNLNSRALQRQVQPVLDHLVAPSTDLIFVTSNPAAVDLVGRFGEVADVYFCMDDYAAMKECSPEIVHACEPEMLARADITFATSRYLCERKTHPRTLTRYLPQGVDYDHFQYRGPCPAPLAAIPRPIIGFQGILGPRVDLALIERITAAFPQASVVTLGRAESDLTRLRRYPNFYHFDPVPYSQLPAWAAQFDISLIAYVKDAHVKSVNPLKLLEYLAMGQQVVSINLPELARFRDRVHVARDGNEYLAQVANLIAAYPFDESARERQRAVARGESWRARASEFIAACEHVVESKRAAAA